MTRFIVCGGRNYSNAERVATELRKIPADWVLVHGNAGKRFPNGEVVGADKLAGTIWQNWGRRIEVYPADWGQYGIAAGPIRNHQMLQGGAELVIAFPGGKGTANMIKQARECQVTIRRVRDG